MAWPGKAWQGKAWQGKAGRGKAGLGWARQGWARPGKARRGMAWPGMAWPGLARLGLARLGVAGQGMGSSQQEESLMATRTVTVTIEGQTALLMHRFPMEPIEALEKKPPAEQAEFAAYRAPGGNLYLPGLNVQRALVSGATYSKGKGRGSLQKAAAACLLVTPEYIDLGTPDYIVDSRPVVVPATKGRVLRHRPRLDDWRVTFTIEFDDTLLSPTNVRRILDDTGTRVGLLEFRPEKRGPFGRFIVTRWDAEPEASADTAPRRRAKTDRP
jgi:hypothetical protein